MVLQAGAVCAIVCWPVEYHALCVAAGFDADKVVSEDRSWQYCTISRTKIDRIDLPGLGRDVFLAEVKLGPICINDLIARWNSEL